MKLGLALNISNNVYHDTYSVLFDGTDDHIVIDAVANDVSTATGTISIWVRGLPMGASSTMIQVAVDTSNFFRLWWKDDDTKLKFQNKRGGTNNIAEYVDADFETDNNFHHLVGTWDTGAASGAGELKLYFDGSLKQTVAINGTFSGTLDKADIAKLSTSDAAFFKGYINEVSIFNNVADVSFLYNSRYPVDLTGTDGLVAYWKLDEGTGTSAFDASGKVNTGTLTNSPVWARETP